MDVEASKGSCDEVTAGPSAHDAVCCPAGLSSFQESVAMDRIQRIMGVLQNPNMG